MKFESELIPGTLVKRYKRFFVDIKIKNITITAHCPNTGSMMGLLKKGNKVWVTKNNNPKRKLKYTLQIIKTQNSKVGINTLITNNIFHEALKDNKIKIFGKLIKIKREQKFGKNTRFDFLIESKKKKIFIEIKNVTLVRKKGIAEFPDAKTSRGVKHLQELINASKKGFDIYIVYIIQREDCEFFSIANDIDKEYAELLTEATKKKLKIVCFDCKFTSKGIDINKCLKFLNYENRF
ncbi:MAG: sugar fermentation stimulation protein SfsA [Pelagibacteraceae bacterium TMED216]|mgnify:CR=1 FL=1|nr:MAG: sugar fermentation stimulation protein SfsA [Pelagibacteraceae bacterium TMED216]|tara:strand:+ start:764 stop:1474 length:711 start_codon:yes stop_codon:yes gene_type:complete